MDQVHQFNIAGLVEALDEELAITLTTLSVDEEKLKHTQLYLIGQLQTLRFAMLSDQLAIGDTWKEIRSKESVFDLITSCTLTLHFHANCLHPDGWERLADLVINAISVFNHPKVKHEHSALEDSRELERFTTKEHIEAAVSSNPWLVTLFMLQRSQVVKELLKQSVQLAIKAQASPKTTTSGLQAGG
jgi:hypothetical protein